MSVLVAEKTESDAAAVSNAAAVSMETFAGLPATHSWTLDDLFLLPDDGRRYEIVDGSLHVSPAPAFLHQLYCAWLHEALAVHKPSDVSVVEGANVVLPAELARLLVPDVLAVRTADVIDADDDNPLAVPASAIPIAVEVVSPSSTTHDRITKPALYSEAGIPHYWRVEIGRDGPTVHLYTLLAEGSGGAEGAGGSGSAGYTRTHVVRPGETVTVETPWTVVLTPPERPAR